jgi:hypothetical protein
MQPRSISSLSFNALLAGAACCIGLLLSAASAQAQVFKWVGPDGKVNYSDVPPPPSTHAQKKNFSGNVLDSGDMPFALAEAMKKNPVTLYTGQKCTPCDDGRTLLNRRGIPFIEKTVSTNADIALLGGGDIDLPQMTVGSARLRGYEAGAWNSRLSAAGYPETFQLPKTYRVPVAEAAAPLPKATPPTSDAVADVPQPATAKPPRRRAPAPTPAPSAVPGLRF